MELTMELAEALSEYMRCVTQLLDVLIEKDVKLPITVTLPMSAANAHLTHELGKVVMQ